MKLLCKVHFLKLLQLACTNCIQNFTCFKKLRFATYSKVSIVSASQFVIQSLKIPNKVSEYIMEILLKGCVIVLYDILAIHFHAMRRCEDLTATKEQNLVKYSIKMALMHGIVQNKDWTCGLVDSWTHELFFSIFY